MTYLDFICVIGLAKTALYLRTINLSPFQLFTFAR